MVGKTVVLVTGVSGGLGNAIAKRFASELPPNSLLILTTSSQKKSSLEGADWLRSDSLTTAIVEWDLGQPNFDQYQNDLKPLVGQFDRAVVIHNAARWGKVPTAVRDMSDSADLQAQLNVNITSMLLINSAFLNCFSLVPDKIVVNITGSAATDPTPGFGHLCLVKSAREMIMNVLAKESSDVKVLHFNPSLIDTGSLRSVRDESADPAMRQWVAGAFASGAVWPADSVAKSLWRHLSQPFESGAKVSVGDNLENK